MDLFKEENAGTTRLDLLNYAKKKKLIPKRDKSQEVEDFQPIALLNGSIKIVTKNLINRLAPKLQIVRLVLSLVGIFYAVLSSSKKIIHQRKKTKITRYLFKLDFDKAYGSINWQYILEVLHYTVGALVGSLNGWHHPRFLRTLMGRQDMR